MKGPDSPPLDPPLVSKVLCEATVLGIDVLVVTANEDLQSPRCRLFFDDTDADHIILRVSKKYVLLSHASISCRFTVIDAPFFFQSRLLGKVKSGSAHHFYRIETPDTIQPNDRRVYLRAQPPVDAPIWIHYSDDKKRSVRVLVEDVSGGGVSLILPNALTLEDMKNPLSCTICLPEPPEADILISPRHKRNLFGVVQIGAEIVSIDEMDRERIIQYVNERLKEKREKSGVGQNADVNLAVIEAPSKKHLFSLLKDNYAINGEWQAQNLTQLHTYLPDLIVLDMNHPQADSCLASIKKTPAFKTRPIVIIGTEKRGLMAFGGGIRYLSHPVNAHHLMRAIDQLIKEYQMTRRVAGVPIRSWQTTTVAMIRLDDSHDDALVDYLNRNNCQTVVVDSQKRIIPELTHSAPECIILETEEDNVATTVCRMLSFNKFLKHCPKILLAHNEELGRQLVSDEAITGFLEKPCPGEKLLSAVFHSLEQAS